MSTLAVIPVPARASTRVPARGNGRLRLTKRGQVVFASLWAGIILLALLFAGLGMSPAAADESTNPADFTYTTVYAGDTLWSIAERVAPNQDPRDTIYQIKKLNTLDSTTVTPGQKLIISTN